MKESNCSVGFITELENIMNFISKNDDYNTAKIGKTTIRYDGEIESEEEGKRQVFFVVRKVD